MITKVLTQSDGVARTVDYKIWPNEVRIYAVRGDVTNTEALKELAQELSLLHACEKVTYRF